MKKLLFFLSFIIAVVEATAQDTIYSVYPPENYFVFEYPNSFEITSSGQIGFFLESDFMGYGRVTKDTLIVYGIAGSLDLPYRLRQGRNWQMVVDRVLDTTRDSSYEYMCMYRASTLPIFVGDSLKINCWTSDVTYYIDFGLGEDPYPVYERYFTAPVQICDSFYIGITNRTHIDYICNYWPINLQGVGGFFGHLSKDTCAVHFSPSAGAPYWRYYWGPRGTYPFIFPILTPNPDTSNNTDPGIDTTGNEPDSVSLQSTDLLARYVGVSPNPATEQVRVVSSFGLTAIEAVDLSGHKVYEGKATGYCALVDVSRWPVGIYLLTIHTPIGMVVKRFTVTR